VDCPSTTTGSNCPGDIIFTPCAGTGVPDPVEGLKYAKTECGNCHVVNDQSGKAPPKKIEGAAPHFKTIAYDPEMTVEKIRETLKLPHGAMANLVLAEKDIENIIGYIVSLRR